MTFTIYRIKNADEFYDVATQEGVPYLTYDVPMAGDEVISTGGTDASLEELVDLCDHDAQNTNAHDFCGTHRLLGAVLYRKLGRPGAVTIMLDIATRGGLHRMSGVCSTTDSFEELGVGECGYDWNGKYD